MRINVYSQELTTDVQLVEKIADTGIGYWGVRIFLHSPDCLHQTPGDDDRSAITFWLPQSADRRAKLADVFAHAAELCRTGPEEVTP